jgi:hypothetical protein
MAKRAALTFDAMKVAKGAPPTSEATASGITPAVAVEKRGRGRPAKRPADARIYGMTLRIPGDVRKQLRRLAEDETDARGAVVSIHDLILEAVEALLIERVVKRGD